MSTTTTHDLKSWPEYFQASAKGTKTFELRKNDRDFKVGDTIVLWEYIPETNTMTGQTIVMKITYVLTSGPWLQPGYCALGIESEVQQAQQQAAVEAENIECENIAKEYITYGLESPTDGDLIAARIRERRGKE